MTHVSDSIQNMHKYKIMMIVAFLEKKVRKIKIKPQQVI